jgi:hypothetical protein
MQCVFILAVWISSLLITAHTVTAHGSHHHKHHKQLKSSRRLRQQDLVPATPAAASAAAEVADVAAIPVDVQAAAEALLLTAEPIPDPPLRNGSKNSRAAVAALEDTEVEPQGGWQRCASNEGSPSKKARTERRFQRLVASMEAANGTAVVAEDVTMRDIPVYMHVITLNRTAGMVYTDQVDAQMRVSTVHRYVLLIVLITVQHSG